MDDREKRLLTALLHMAWEYLGCHYKDAWALDCGAMHAGETAIGALAEYRLVEVDGSGRIFGRWTDAGRQLFEREGYRP